MGLRFKNNNIHIFLQKEEQLYSKKNFLTVNENFIEKEIENYIFESVKRYPLKTDVKIVVHLPNYEKDIEAEQITNNIHRHFEFLTMQIKMVLDRGLKQFWINMFISILFIIICCILIVIFDKLEAGQITIIAKEVLYVIISIALWDPMIFILFGYQKILREKAYCSKLTSVPIVIDMYSQRIEKHR